LIKAEKLKLEEIKNKKTDNLLEGWKCGTE
jgi:hypothetical protein